MLIWTFAGNSVSVDMQKARPTGVTLVGIFLLITAAVSLLSGISNVYAVVTHSSMLGHAIVPESLGPFRDLFTVESLFLATGAFHIAIGALAFVPAFGVLKGKGWSWQFAIGFALFEAAYSVRANVIGTGIDYTMLGVLAIDAAILYYLFRPHVRSYFGKAPTPGATTGPTS